MAAEPFAGFIVALLSVSPMSTRYLFDTALNLDYSACCYLQSPMRGRLSVAHLVRRRSLDALYNPV